jgi:hypothetical protein
VLVATRDLPLAAGNAFVQEAACWRSRAEVSFQGEIKGKLFLEICLVIRFVFPTLMKTNIWESTCFGVGEDHE